MSILNQELAVYWRWKQPLFSYFRGGKVSSRQHFIRLTGINVRPLTCRKKSNMENRSERDTVGVFARSKKTPLIVFIHEEESWLEVWWQASRSPQSAFPAPPSKKTEAEAVGNSSRLKLTFGFSIILGTGIKPQSAMIGNDAQTKVHVHMREPVCVCVFHDCVHSWIYRARRHRRRIH